MKMTEKELMEAIGKTVDEKIKPLLSINTSARPTEDVKTKEATGFSSLGEQLFAVAQVERNKTIDPRLLNTKQSGMNEGVGAEGGFLVVPEFGTKLLEQAYTTGVVAKDCWKVPISRNSLSMVTLDESSRADGYRQGGIKTYWAGEAAEKTSSAPTFRQIDLKLKKHIGLYYSTDELLEDTMALEAIVSRLFGNEFGFRIDDAIINGTGAGMPLGILNGGGLVTRAAEGAQLADTVVAANVMGMWNLMPAANRRNAKWYVNQDVEPQLMQMYIEAGLGGMPVFMPAGGLTQSPNGTIFGRPVECIEQCPALGDVGDIIFADLSQYLIIEKAGGIASASSIHVKFINDETTFRFVYRMDGQPLWNAGVTAFDGVTTRSPYVALAARA